MRILDFADSPDGRRHVTDAVHTAIRVGAKLVQIDGVQHVPSDTAADDLGDIVQEEREPILVVWNVWDDDFIDDSVFGLVVRSLMMNDSCASATADDHVTLALSPIALSELASDADVVRMPWVG